MHSVVEAERPWWRDGRVAVLVAITVLTLCVGWAHKAQCHDRDWDGYQWTKMCYSDIQALYGSRGVGDGQWPYVETFNEYPPLTGLFMHAMDSIAGGPAASDDGVPHARNVYLAVTAAFLGALAIVTTILLGELVGRDRKVLYWALAPALMLYAFYNWDLLAIAPTIGAVLAFRKGHMGIAGGLLALGACAKLYPAFLAPALGLWILRDDGGLKRRGWSFGLAFVGVWLAIHLPLFLIDRHGIVDAYRFQATRGPNFETVWYGLGHIGRTYHVGILDAFDDPFVYKWGSLLPLLAAFAVSGWAAWTRRLDPVAAACLPVFAFLACNKVFSIQYTLWAIPLLLLAPVPRLLKVLVVVADLTVFVTLANYFALSDLLEGNARGGQLFTPVAIAALFRGGVYAAVAVHLVQVARRRPAAPPAPASEAQAA